MASKTEIANLAIRHLGIGKPIGNLETEQSQEAAACRVFFDTVRDAVLEDFAWPFASQIRALGLIESDPTTEWAYSYAYPSDCLRFGRILSGIRTDTRQSVIPYRRAKIGDNEVILTDQDDAVAEFTIKITDTGLFSSAFTLAMSYRLAYYVAPSITGGDPFNIQERVGQLYIFELEKAQVNALNEVQQDEVPESEFTRAREGFDSTVWPDRGDD
jgi:hypothetical protein